MAGASRLGIYNQALRICGERRISTLGEPREPRYLLDAVWSDEDGVGNCLEEGQWNFAMRAVRIDFDPNVTTNFGLAYGFTKPTDWVRTCGFCSDERFETPFRFYKDEGSFWYADITPIYVRYVSNDAAWGKDLSKWPGTFQSFVAAYFASRIIKKLTQDKARRDDVLIELKRSKRDAMNKDAMNEPAGQPFRGSWSRARYGRGNPGSNDGGSRSRLIG